jgi:hypothetical protein
MAVSWRGLYQIQKRERGLRRLLRRPDIINWIDGEPLANALESHPQDCSFRQCTWSADDGANRIGHSNVTRGRQVVIKNLAAGPHTTIMSQGPNWFTVHFDNDGGLYDAVFQIKGS